MFSINDLDCPLLLFAEEMIIEAATLSSVDESSKTLPNNEDILSLVQLAENSSLVGTMLLEEAVNISNEITSTSKIASKFLSCFYGVFFGVLI